jgi:hypothetical protein
MVTQVMVLAMILMSDEDDGDVDDDSNYDDVDADDDGNAYDVGDDDDDRDGVCVVFATFTAYDDICFDCFIENIV